MSREMHFFSLLTISFPYQNQFLPIPQSPALKLRTVPLQKDLQIVYQNQFMPIRANPIPQSAVPQPITHINYGQNI